MYRHLLLLGALLVAGPALAAPPPGGAGAPAAERDGGRALEALQRNDPERYRKVVEVQAARPGLYRELLRGVGGLALARNGGAEGREAVVAIIDEVYTLHTALTAFEQATGKAREKARADLEASVGRLFELRQQARRAQLAALEARLEQLRTEIAERDAARGTLVREFTDRLVEKSEPGF